MLSVAYAGPSASLGSDVLACIQAGDADAPNDPRVLRLGMDALAGSAALELWRGAAPVSLGETGEFRFARNGEYFFGQRRVPEAALGDMAEATRQLYSELTALLKQQGFPWLLRSWNYIHDIHRGDGDAERYRQFCLGRHRAVAGAPGYERALPAATVIGTTAPGMLIYFLAGKTPGRQVENPRQTSAFRYPREYGPASPSFSRATLVASSGLLLMSGTASVVGHATRHPHDSQGQLDELLANVEALLHHASTLHVLGNHWTPQMLRMYLRDPADLALAQTRVREAFGAEAPGVFMQGDICRTDLRLEIEGVYAPAGTRSPG